MIDSSNSNKLHVIKLLNTTIAVREKIYNYVSHLWTKSAITQGLDSSLWKSLEGEY